MRRSVFNLSILMLLALYATGLCSAQQAAEANPQSFPIIRGSKTDGLPRKFTARGTVTQVHYSPPHCGELIFPATFEIKLDDKPSGYRYPFLYLVVPCLYQPQGAEKFLNRRIEITAQKQDETAQPCFVDIRTSRINSKGVPFYCADREELLKNVMPEPVVSAKEPFEFAGTLEKGSTYRAAVILDQKQGWRLVAPLKIPYHHAMRVEWLNLKEFPELYKPQPGSRLKQIVFKVAAKEVFQIAGRNRWSTTYYCRIVEVAEAPSRT